MTSVDGLSEESKCLDIRFGTSQTEESSLSFTDLETVIQFGNLEDSLENSSKKRYLSERFCSTRHNLNTLAMKTTIMRTQTNEGVDTTEKEIVNANGTWQSILKWGQNERLDDDQQTAFEILAATYVLSFSDEAIIDAMSSETSNVVFEERRKVLLQLARKSADSDSPLCMFVTGPAGAGKCKSIYRRSNSTC